MPWQRLSIIVPVLNEADNIEAFLKHLQPFREREHEVVLVDGKSSDNTCQLARPWVDRMMSVQKGRARQQAIGAKMATGQIFLFLHADTRLPEQADQLIFQAVERGGQWGRFNVRLSGSAIMFRIIAAMMNTRSCLTGIATGDQAIFVNRSLYHNSGSFPDIPLMEDIEFSRRLKTFSRPACIKTPVCTSSRRWQQNGTFKTIFFMWSLRLQYFFGISPAKLHQKYYPSND